MIVDSTALPERAVTDIIASAFQSAGQRCSALRLLYVQEDIASDFLTMLYGAMDELNVGDPWQFATDVGTLINGAARVDIQAYIDEADSKKAVLKKIAVPNQGHFIAPTVIKVNGISDMTKEIFGPVLHVATFKACEIDQIMSDINDSGEFVQLTLNSLEDERKVVSSIYLPGPTGESNKLSVLPIGKVLCLGPTREMAIEQASEAQKLGCQTLIICPGAMVENSLDGFLARSALSELSGFSAVICASDQDDLAQIRQALAGREGALVPLIAERNIAERCVIERHVCIDTTAAGGNVSLLASMG